MLNFLKRHAFVFTLLFWTVVVVSTIMHALGQNDRRFIARQKLACQYEKFCEPDTTPTWFDEAQDCFCVGNKP